MPTSRRCRSPGRDLKKRISLLLGISHLQRAVESFVLVSPEAVFYDSLPKGRTMNTKIFAKAKWILVLTALLVAPVALAVSPAPDGGYGGNNTAEGDSSLFSLTSGIDNSALGFQALFRNRNGSYNTAAG